MKSQVLHTVWCNISTRPWRQTLTNRSDVRYVFPRAHLLLFPGPCNGTHGSLPQQILEGNRAAWMRQSPSCRAMELLLRLQRLLPSQEYVTSPLHIACVAGGLSQCGEQCSRAPFCTGDRWHSNIQGSLYSILPTPSIFTVDWISVRNLRRCAYSASYAVYVKSFPFSAHSSAVYVKSFPFSAHSSAVCVPVAVWRDSADLGAAAEVQADTRGARANPGAQQEHHPLPTQLTRAVSHRWILHHLLRSPAHLALSVSHWWILHHLFRSPAQLTLSVSHRWILHHLFRSPSNYPLPAHRWWLPQANTW